MRAPFAGAVPGSVRAELVEAQFLGSVPPRPFGELRAWGERGTRRPARLAAVVLVLALAAELGAGGPDLDPPAVGTFRSAASPPALQSIFGRLDADADGWLTKDELLRVSSEHTGSPRDFDGDGKVSEAEFARSFREIYFWCSGDQYPLVEGQLGEARLLMALGYIDRAFERARSSAARFPEWSNCWSFLGELQANAGLMEESERSCRKAVQLAANNAGAWCSLAGTLMSMARGPEAMEALERGLELLAIEIAMFGHDSIGMVSAAYDAQIAGLIQRFMMQLRRPDVALRIADWARRHRGPNARLEALRIAARSMAGDRAEALAEARTAEAAAADGDRHLFVSLQGRLQMMSGRVQEAADLFREALALCKDPAEQRPIRVDLCASLLRSGRTTEAASRLGELRAQAIAPAQKLPVAQILMDSGDPAAAASLIEEAVAAARRVPDLWMRLARARAAMGDRAGYIATLERALDSCEAAGFRAQASDMLRRARIGEPLPAGFPARGSPRGPGTPPGG